MQKEKHSKWINVDYSLNYFEKDRADTDFFDVMFNTATMTDEEIIEMILIVSETRGFVL